MLYVIILCKEQCYYTSDIMVFLLRGFCKEFNLHVSLSGVLFYMSLEEVLFTVYVPVGVLNM